MNLKPIPDFPDYFASDDGEIYSMKPWGRVGCVSPPDEPRLVKKSLRNKRGISYYAVGLWRGKKQFRVKNSTMILTAFVSPRPKGMLACHGVNGRYDDSLANLYWGTPKQNQSDRFRDGTALFGEKHPSHKLNEIQVRIIRKAHELYGVTMSALAHIFNVSVGTIYGIINGKSWTHI